MKKISIVAFIVILIVASGFLLMRSKEVQSSLEMTATNATATPEQVTRMQEEITRAKKVEKNSDESNEEEDELTESLVEESQVPLTEAELDELEEYFDQVEGQWNTDMENFITQELRMPKDVYEKYEVLRDAYEKDKYQAFNDFHEEMFKKHGASYSYNPSEFNGQFENNFRDEYLVKMKDLIGEENMVRYFELLDKTNEKLMRDARPGHGHISIDL